MARSTPSRRGFLKTWGPVGVCLGATPLAAVLADCAASTAGAPTPAVRRDVTLYYQNWDDLTAYRDSYGAWYNAVFQAFMQRFPGVKVEYVTTPGGEIVEKIIATVAAGTPVDVSVNSIVHGRDLFDKGVLRPLDDFMRKAPDLAPSKYFDVANFYRSARNMHFGLPIYVDSSLLAVNSRLLRKAGLDPKAGDLKTWDDLVRYSERLTKREGGQITQLGFAFGRPGLQEVSTFAYANGAELQDTEVTKAVFNTPPSSQRMADMLRYRAVNYQRFGLNWHEDLKGDLFQLGKMAILYTSMGIQVRIRGGTYVPKDFEYWFVPNPKGPSGTQPGVTTWVNMIVQPQGGKQPDLAFELARAVAGPDGQAKMFQFASLHPSLKDFYQSKEFAEGVRNEPVMELVPKLAAIGKSYPFFRRFNDINREISPLFADAVEGKLDHQQALAEAERKANAILSGT